jgi:hypothetical protein
MHRKSALIAPSGHFSRKREKIDGRPLCGRLYKPERAGRKEQLTLPLAPVTKIT